MEEELNIAAILKDKPKGTKLWSPIVGDCIFNGINSENGAIIASFINKDGEMADWDFNEYGKTLSASKKAEVCLFPSKQMRDLQKFAWKKGDVLAVAGENIHVLFLHWASNDYTRFRCKDEETLTELENDTKDFVSVSDEEAKKTIKAIEESYNGKLNLETLTVEYTKPEFKDGDILHNDETDYNFETIFIANKHDNTIGTYAFLVVHNEDLYIKYEDFDESGEKAIRPATESEKQQLFSALAKEGKRWIQIPRPSRTCLRSVSSSLRTGA